MNKWYRILSNIRLQNIYDFVYNLLRMECCLMYTVSDTECRMNVLFNVSQWIPIQNLTFEWFKK